MLDKCWDTCWDTYWRSLRWRYLASFEDTMVKLITSAGPKDVKSWGYQLQGNQDRGEALEALDLLAAEHDVIVMDFSKDGLDSGRYHAEDIASLRARQPSSVIISYMSIGEASDYRSHWNKAWTSNGRATGKPTSKAPSWLGPNNESWQNSCKVRFWEEGWQNIIFNEDRTGWLDLIAAQGFDGAYLDIVDAYYFWGADVPSDLQRDGDPENERDGARRMIEFIAGFTAHVRERYPDFMIFPQNGEMILDALGDPASLGDEDRARKKMFIKSVSAIGVEDVYCPGDRPQNNAMTPSAKRIEILKRDFRDNGKPVFSVDYLDQQATIDKYLARCAKDGFVPYAAPHRNLDRLGPPFDGDVADIVATRGVPIAIDPTEKTSPAPRRSPTAPRMLWRGGKIDAPVG